MTLTAVPGQDHHVLRFDMETQSVDRFPVVAWVLSANGDGDVVTKPVTASDTSVWDANVMVATLLPNGRVVDVDQDYASEADWLVICKAIAAQLLRQIVRVPA